MSDMTVQGVSQSDAIGVAYPTTAAAGAPPVIPSPAEQQAGQMIGAIEAAKMSNQAQTGREAAQTSSVKASLPAAERLFIADSQEKSRAEQLGLEPLPPVPLMELARTHYEALKKLSETEAGEVIEPASDAVGDDNSDTKEIA